ncbi:hypothetical protein Salat_0745600 [Sesamum alatum]|uniref:NLP1-9 GAF domain-containing protein n=1 Tax=Sesamum alatum TaxID=300844 RepID=A0AAE1YTA7_9LAMI|nr:hypothetical protein Salat_0745600 [Sesamum alatum]
MLELAIDAIPEMHLAQVWIPCTQCGNMSCMERASFINSADMEFGSSKFCDPLMLTFLEACEFQHRLTKTGVAGIPTAESSCLVRSLCDMSICEYPLAHYAQKARLSFCFTIHLQSVWNMNNFFVVEFFLQSHSREDAYPWSISQLLLQIMETKLKTFKIVSEQQLPMGSPGTSEMIQHVEEKEHENSREFTLISRIEGYNESLSVSDLKECLQEVDFSIQESDRGVFCCPRRDDQLLDYLSIQEKVKNLIMEIMSSKGCSLSVLVQFWAAETEDKYLTTLDQPFGLANCCNGLFWFRKLCMGHRYSVDDGTKEEELGPPGCVFQNRYPESTADLRLYSTEEFPHRDYAVKCGFRTYLALPVFNLHQDECVGVLECMGLHDTKINFSRSILKRACRHYGIKRWPSSPENKKNPSLFQTSTSNKRAGYSEQQVLVSSSSSPPPQVSPLHNQNVLQISSGTESSQNRTKLTEADVVLIKAKFGDDTVKVQLLASSGIGKLKEELCIKTLTASG